MDDAEEFTIILEPTETGYSAYSPDVEGVYATGRTIEEAVAEMRDAIAFHLAGLTEAEKAYHVHSSIVHRVRIEPGNC
ncbi:MAG TPA: type II toxin-antitoxin system HicB family antitoxin [Thermomicrobiaceae bacterium]|nr:type II toxin-antitoxin system HicB family antitoxin [Thermomicrobiaceae bacterium]